MSLGRLPDSGQAAPPLRFNDGRTTRSRTAQLIRLSAQLLNSGLTESIALHGLDPPPNRRRAKSSSQSRIAMLISILLPASPPWRSQSSLCPDCYRFVLTIAAPSSTQIMFPLSLIACSIVPFAAVTLASSQSPAAPPRAACQPSCLLRYDDIYLSKNKRSSHSSPRYSRSPTPLTPPAFSPQAAVFLTS